MESKKRERLTAKKKFEIYLETKQAGAKVGEILRREGIHLADLRKIEDLVERGAVGALKAKGSGRGIRKKIDPLEFQQVKEELAEKEKAMNELLVEHMLLKKKDRLESRGILRESRLEEESEEKGFLRQLRKRRKRG